MIKKIEKSHQARKSRTPIENGRAKDDIFAEKVLPELAYVGREELRQFTGRTLMSSILGKAFKGDLQL